MTSLEQHSKAWPGRRRKTVPGLGRFGMAVAVVAALAGAAIVPTLSASADQLQKARAQASQIAAQIQAQGQQLAVLSERYDEDQIHVQQLDQQLSQTQAQVAQTKGQVSVDEGRLRQLAIEDYMTGGSSTGLEQLFEPGGETSVATKEYEQVAGGDISVAIDQLNASESELNAQESSLQSTESQAHATLAAAQTARAGAQSALSQQEATLTGLKGQIKTLVAAQQAAQARAQQAAFEARVAAQRSSASAGSDSSLPDLPPVAGGGGAAAVAAAESQIGVPYVWAGATPGVGFDCSGLTMWAWGRAGVSLSHSAAAQYSETAHVPLSDLQPGDLLFYREGGTIGHVTMYVGPGAMVQAMETGTRIQITGIWTSGLVGAGRP